MTDEIHETDETQQDERPQAEVNRDPGFLDAVFKQATGEMSAGRSARDRLPRRYVTFVMDADSCAPGIFPEDFEITLESLASQQEVEAARAAQGDPTSMAYHLARSS
ncbi:MAG: hypothetical protein ACODAG_09370, partial [Myxococcota bacterium]